MKSFQIREGEKGIFEVLKWYNDINSFILDYISVSIKDSDVSDFYRYVIGFKNLLRSVEFGGKSSIYGYRYLAQGFLERHYMHDFIRYEMLRKEYLNQTFNFVVGLQQEYDELTGELFYEHAQVLITEKEKYERVGLSTYLFVTNYSFNCFLNSVLLKLQIELEKNLHWQLRWITSRKV